MKTKTDPKLTLKAPPGTAPDPARFRFEPLQESHMVSIRFPGPMLERLDTLAAALGRTRTEVTLRLLDVALEEAFAANGITALGPSRAEQVRERRRGTKRP
jgi:hypothetical protein